MDFREIEEKQKINKIKAKNDCLVCEVVITKEFKEAPISIIEGNGGPIEMAQMVKTLVDVANQLKENFPEVKGIIPILNERGGMKMEYKRVERRE